MTVAGGDWQLYIFICEHVYTLDKSRKENRIKFFSPVSYFYFVFISKGAIVSGKRSRVFFFSFYAFFSLSLFVGFKGNYSPGPFQLSNATKDNLLFPAPTLAFFSNKSSLCWEWSSFHRDPSSSHELGALFYFISKWPLTNAGRHGMLQLMLCTGRCCPSVLASLTASSSEHSLFLQAGFLTTRTGYQFIYNAQPGINQPPSKGLSLTTDLDLQLPLSGMSPLTCQIVFSFFFMIFSSLLLRKHIEKRALLNANAFYRKNYGPSERINICQSPVSYKYLLR